MKRTSLLLQGRLELLDWVPRKRLHWPPPQQHGQHALQRQGPAFLTQQTLHQLGCYYINFSPTACAFQI